VRIDADNVDAEWEVGTGGVNVSDKICHDAMHAYIAMAVDTRAL
jgi:hypothetical protein